MRNDPSIPRHALAREGDFQVRHDLLISICKLAREGDPQSPDNGYDPSVPGRTLARAGDPQA